MTGNDDVVLKHLLAGLPTAAPDQEAVDILAHSAAGGEGGPDAGAGKDGVRIERIISYGHQTPAEDWYDQDQHEWVMVVQGQARLEFAGGKVLMMTAGDHVLIPAHCRHRVAWTTPDQPTVWVAVFYDAAGGSAQP